MQGKLVCSQSSSTRLSRKRFSMKRSTEFSKDFRFVKKEAERACRFPDSRIYLLTVTSALVSPATVTALDEFFAPSCQPTMLYCPSGTFSILYSPLLSVFAKYGVGATTM